MKASSIPMKASKAEVRAILPKGNEEQDNDDWAKFEVSAGFPHTQPFASLPSPSRYIPFHHLFLFFSIPRPLFLRR